MYRTDGSDGGPAFPYIVDDLEKCKGMTLRDWIAGNVVAAAMTNTEGLGQYTKEERRVALDAVAEISYEVADAMLEERSK